MKIVEVLHHFFRADQSDMLEGGVEEIQKQLIDLAEDMGLLTVGMARLSEDDDVLSFFPHEEMVRDFHAEFGVDAPKKPAWPAQKVLQLRVDLIQEEWEETLEAMARGDMAEVVDGLVDLLYVTYGALISFGVRIQPVFAEVHRANMAKVGGSTREDGKILKPEGWKPPDIEGELKKQGWRR